MAKVKFSDVQFFDPESIYDASYSLSKLADMPIKDVIVDIEFYDDQPTITVDAIVLADDRKLYLKSNVVLDHSVEHIKHAQTEKLRAFSKEAAEVLNNLYPGEE